MTGAELSSPPSVHRWPRRRSSAPGPGTEDYALDASRIVARLFAVARRGLDQGCSLGRRDRMEQSMPVTISRAQRDAIYELVVTHLSGIGDVWLCVGAP